MTVMNDTLSAHFPGRVAIQQRVLPQYRAAFFEQLAGACEGGLAVFAGVPKAKEAIQTTNTLDTARYKHVRNVHLFSVGNPFYLCWQAGLASGLKKWDPDVLVLEANPRYPASRPAVRWMKSRGRMAAAICCSIQRASSSVDKRPT